MRENQAHTTLLAQQQLRAPPNGVPPLAPTASSSSSCHHITPHLTHCLTHTLCSSHLLCLSWILILILMRWTLYC